jgi:hypothetical protein
MLGAMNIQLKVMKKAVPYSHVPDRIELLQNRLAGMMIPVEWIEGLGVVQPDVRWWMRSLSCLEYCDLVKMRKCGKRSQQSNEQRLCGSPTALWPQKWHKARKAVWKGCLQQELKPANQGVLCASLAPRRA